MSPGPPDALPDDAWLRTAGRVGVHGLGREGRSVLADLSTTNPEAEVVVFDDVEPSPGDRTNLADQGITLEVGATSASTAVDGLDLLVRSPGVPPSHPVQRAAAAAGVPATTALNIFFARHRPRNVVAVTGTKGKSTTSTLLGHLLARAGRRVRVAGNVGLSVLDLDVDPATLDHLVLELSSYQLADLRGRPTIGVWLNLHRDHHDWHGGRDGYVRDKTRIVAQSERIVGNAGDDAVMAAVDGHAAVVTFDARTDPLDLGGVALPRQDLVTALDASALVGAHNLTNLAAALTVAGMLGLDAHDLLGFVGSFRPLAHRLELVHDDGRRWVDDSIATIPEATVAAMDAFPDLGITLLVGGHDRGQDHEPLVRALLDRPTVDRGLRVVALPDTGHRLATELVDVDHHVDEVTAVDDLDAAVAVANTTTPFGDVVLLSPAAASFNQFRSFEDRGEQFARLARATSPP